MTRRTQAQTVPQVKASPNPLKSASTRGGTDAHSGDHPSRPEKLKALAPSPCPPVRRPIPIEPRRIVASRWINRDEAAFSDAEFASLCADIRKCGGNLIPIKVRRLRVGASNGQQTISVGASNNLVKPLYEVVYGHRRHRACMAEGVKVLAFVDKMDDTRLAYEMITENSCHQQPSAWERGTMYCRMLDEGLFQSMHAMADALHLQVSEVCRAITLARLDPEIIAAMVSPRDLGVHDADGLGKLIKEDLAGVLLRVREGTAATGPLPAKDILRLMKRPSPLPVAPVDPFETTALTCNGKANGEISIRADGLIKVSLNSGLPLAKLIKMRADFERLIELSLQ